VTVEWLKNVALQEVTQLISKVIQVAERAIKWFLEYSFTVRRIPPLPLPNYSKFNYENRSN
jgi:hypothetical protein